MSAAVAQLAALLDHLQTRVSELEKRSGVATTSAPVSASSAPAPKSAVDDDPESQTRDWDALVAKYGEEVAKIGGEIGGDAAELGKAFLSLFQANRKYIHIATKCKKPDADTLAKLRAEVVAAATPIFDLKKKRDCTHPNHAAGMADAAPAFAWVNMEVGPLDMITSAKEGCDFFLNKVRKESKEKNLPTWMTFANLVRDGTGAVYDYVKEHYKGGLTFNPKGVDYATFASSVGGSAPAPAQTASAPAPVPAETPASPTPAPASGAGAVDNAALQSKLFAQLQSIDQSSGRTAGLRHVTKDMKASANKDAPAPVAVKAVTPKAPAASKDDVIPTGTARVELVDKRWYVEFQQTSGAQIHVPPEANITQEVYIYGCKDAAIFVDSKVKGVRMDKCRNVTLILQSVLSGVEIVNCKKIKMQVNQSLPSVAVDKTDGIVIGLAWPARDAQIVTSKSSEMNVTFPVSAEQDADWIELPIPEQFVTKLMPDNKLKSDVSDLYTH